MDAFKKVFLAGVGALSLSKAKAKKIVEELIEQGQIRKDEGQHLVEEMLHKADSTRTAVEDKVKKNATQAYQKLNLATQKQLEKMEKRIHSLEQQLAKKNAANTKKGQGKP